MRVGPSFWASARMRCARLAGGGWLLKNCATALELPRFMDCSSSKKLTMPLRVVARAVHDLRAHQVGLVLVVTAEFLAQRAQGDGTDGVGDLRAGAAAAAEAQQAAQDADAGLRGVGLAGLVRAVAQRHVRHLVRQHTHQLRLVARGLEVPRLTYM